VEIHAEGTEGTTDATDEAAGGDVETPGMDCHFHAGIE
jgi:hypothetical protein